MNRDQLAIRAAMEAQGWWMARRFVDSVGNMELWYPESGIVRAEIRGNRSIEVFRVIPGLERIRVRPSNAAKQAHFCYVQAYKGRGWLPLAVSIATAAAKTSLTSEQFGNILHAIGGGANGYTRPGYRNYYTVSDRKPSLDALVEGGFMAYRKGETMGVYHVTPKGAAEVGCAGCLEQK